jgi:hypothetical protein
MKVFRPFWSYDILAAEAWLNRMSLDGYHLTSIDLVLRLFVFEKGIPQNTQYRLYYNKRMDGMIDEYAGWECVYTAKKFAVLHSNNVKPSLTPSYSGVLERNRKIKYISSIIFFIFSMFLIPNIIMLGVTVVFLFKSETIVLREGATFFVTHQSTTIVMEGVAWLIGVPAAIWLIYTIYKLQSAGSRFERDFRHGSPRLKQSAPAARAGSGEQERMAQERTEQERPELERKNLIKKRKHFWAYAPDKLEKWLENMESQGYNLCKVSEFGFSFYFTKGIPRIMKYSIDCQKKADSDYYSLHKDCGWKLVYQSSMWTHMLLTSIWSYECLPGFAQPEFYSDKNSRIKHARRIVLTYSLAFLFVGAMAVCLIMLMYFSRANMSYFMQCFMIIYPPVILFLYGGFSLKIIRYYFRIKKLCRESSDV